MIIDDTLLRRAKELASRMGLSLSGLVEHALRDALATRPESVDAFRMPTYGEPGAGVRHEPDELAEVLLEEDARPWLLENC
ncbi:MAG: hypothetical protein FJ125_18535 [Deltaproteobacteria bacterium]|nr:hypothetical protein [Deltaproteobacteria bacterium]